MNKTNNNQKLGHQVARGGLWVFALRITERIFSLARIIILARILAPTDFGLLGIALLVLATLDTFSQTGFDTALIQRKDDINGYLDTTWTISIIRGVILFGVLYLVAPYAAAFFGTPEATLIIQAIGLSFLFQAFTNVGVVFFQKELDFKKQYIYQLSGTMTDFIVAVSAALILRNVWALVYGLVAGHFVRLVASYFVHSYRPRLSFDLKKATELFGFGKWVFGSSILIFLITQGDDAFVGKFLGATALGFYQLAYRLSNLPATEITKVISQVTLPAYAKIQDDIPRLKEAYLKVLQLTAFLSFPIAGLIFILAPDFTLIFLGEKWMPIVPVMQVLVCWGLIRSIGATTGPIFQSIGKPGIATKLQLILLILLAILIYPLSVQFGVIGTSLAVVFAALIPNLMAFYITNKVIRCTMLDSGKLIVLPLLNSAIMILSITALKTYWVSSINFIAFLLLTTCALLTYLGMSFLSDKFFNYGMKTLIKENILLKRYV